MLEQILHDHTKFQKLHRNRINQMELKIKLITANNLELDNLKLIKIIGDYTPDYIYGTIKTHKPNFVLLYAESPLLFIN